MNDDLKLFFKLLCFSVLIFIALTGMANQGFYDMEARMVKRDEIINEGMIKRDEARNARLKVVETKMFKLHHKVNHWNSDQLRDWRRKELNNYEKREEYIGRGSDEILVGRESNGKMYLGSKEVVFRWTR